jgi:hypothetical protein
MVPRTRTEAVALRIPRRRFTVDEYHGRTRVRVRDVLG